MHFITNDQYLLRFMCMWKRQTNILPQVMQRLSSINSADSIQLLCHTPQKQKYEDAPLYPNLFVVIQVWQKNPSLNSTSEAVFAMQNLLTFHGPVRHLCLPLWENEIA